MVERRPWTLLDIARMRRMAKAGASIPEVMAALQRTKGSVTGVAARENIVFRSPKSNAALKGTATVPRDRSGRVRLRAIDRFAECLANGATPEQAASRVWADSRRGRRALLEIEAGLGWCGE